MPPLPYLDKFNLALILFITPYSVEEHIWNIPNITELEVDLELESE